MATPPAPTPAAPAEDRARTHRVQEELADKLETLRADKKALQVQVGQLERENALVEQRQFYETELSSMRNASRSAGWPCPASEGVRRSASL